MRYESVLPTAVRSTRKRTTPALPGAAMSVTTSIRCSSGATGDVLAHELNPTILHHNKPGQSVRGRFLLDERKAVTTPCVHGLGRPGTIRGRDSARQVRFFYTRRRDSAHDPHMALF